MRVGRRGEDATGDEGVAVAGPVGGPPGGGNVSEARCNDFITRLQAKGHQGNLQGIGAIRTRYDMRGAQVLREFCSKCLHFFATNKDAFLQNALNGGINFGFDLLILGLKIDHL